MRNYLSEKDIGKFAKGFATFQERGMFWNEAFGSRPPYSDRGLIRTGLTIAMTANRLETHGESDDD
ncbi:hypothetical protein N825_33180 [Skermanella stibiiresistens SB22]|uniref:Uncharacterized protein n=1 Tax=Skermanella stibiiresistens SB22 TaxID=1385369 RepID=W9H409_9PROT|nr:hypothetical protein N825_33180 [Skermanella stibiiresistens SB22]